MAEGGAVSHGGAPHGVVLLAAGASRRLGRAKQLVRLDGESFVRRAARLSLVTAPRDAVAVLGVQAERVAAELEGLDIRVVFCTDWARGLGSSLRRGLGALDPAVEGALVLLCDQPGLTPSHLLRLTEAWRADPSRAVASGYAGTVGVPAILPRAWFAGVQAGLDQGARALLRGRREEMVVIDDERLARDVDSPADLVSSG